jgi:hypothetical protein
MSPNYARVKQISYWFVGTLTNSINLVLAFDEYDVD